MTMFSWNAGGLKQSDWDNLQLWLSRQEIAVVMIQETKWNHCFEWLTDTCTCIHSATNPAKTGGLLTLISKKLIAQQRVSWQELLPMGVT